ncbi:MAG: MBL fold metallo-hydrolase [Spirochaetales bacterium]|jgi:phosphoribosyl 1,2-cyclic phosphodiesterase|nr:MBL fold metallo-hydrolase [Spirochaetales bacterium]
MRVKFWGVRGSIPTPVTPDAIRSKIATVVQRIRPSDLVSPVTRELFLSQLPSWLFDHAGGNTACVEINLKPESVIVLDAGSGLREFGLTLVKRIPVPKNIYMFFSHFHWDHLQGLPFFSPIVRPDLRVSFCSPESGLRQCLNEQMRFPFFPVTLENMDGGRSRFVQLKNMPLKIDGAEITWRKMNHPGGCYSYKISDGKHNVIYATDSELTENDFDKNAENIAYFHNADLIILDSQYTLGEAIEKFNWGHSSFSLAVDFASEWNIKNLCLFHHEPLYNDRKLHNNLQQAQWYYSHLGKSGMNIILAEEGQEIEF